MHVLAAPDKFRGTATAPEVAAAIAAAIADLGGTTQQMPLADGGEGTLDAFGGPNRSSTVTGPLGGAVRAEWRMNDNGTAIIEMALASGLILAGGADRNDPWGATTAGTGELIRAATDEGARRIVVGLGGSATTDGGLGALDALIRDPIWDPHRANPARPELLVCCDVQTAFVDAAYIFGPQKGADGPMVTKMRERLTATAARYLDEYEIDVTALTGGGAAGGLAGALAVLGGRLKNGFDLVADTVGLDSALTAADLVITGEGHLDHSSYDGKVVGGVLHRARAHTVPVVVVVGDRSAPEPNDPSVTVLNLVEQFGQVAAMTDTAGSIRKIVHAHVNNPDR